MLYSLIALIFVLRAVTWGQNAEHALTVFPDACSANSLAAGCTRIQFLEDGCVRPEQLKGKSIQYDIQKAAHFNESLKECLLTNPRSRIVFQTRATINDIAFAHVQVSSLIFGFVDDFYIRIDLHGVDDVTFRTQS